MDKIFSLCCKLGQSHSRLVSSIYLKTLQIDKRFLSKEPDWTDPVYIAKMILIHAASTIQPTLLEAAPTFFSKHLTYFKDKYPQYFQVNESVPEAENSLLRIAEQKMLLRIKGLLASGNGLPQVLKLTRNSYE